MHLSGLSLPDRPVIRANHGTVTQMQRTNGGLQSPFLGPGGISTGVLPTLAPRAAALGAFE